jgi:putative ABC transport system permease protein
MTQDLRFAVRTLRRQPVPYTLAVLCLGLGLGANAALFGVIDAILFRPPPEISEPSSVVRVRVGQESPATFVVGPSATYPQYQAIREQQALLFQDIAAYSYRELGFGRGMETQQLNAIWATPNYFATLGVRARIGRFFDATDTNSPVVVISDHLWRSAFGGRSDVIGKVLETSGGALTIVGVAPRAFVGADLGAPDAWLPIDLAFTPEFGKLPNRTNSVYWLQMVGRLRAGATLEQARKHLDDPSVNAYVVNQVPVSLLPLRTMFFAAQAGQNPIPTWLGGITLALLLLACGTVANLLLAQASHRGAEMSVRLALGATRLRLVRQLLLENVLLAGLSAVFAVLVALWSTKLLGFLPLPPLGNVVGWRTLAFIGLLSTVTVGVFGIAPALWSLRRDVAGVLKSEGRLASGAAVLQRSLMAAQIAISFALLFCAVVFVQSLRNVKAIDTGLSVDRVVTATVNRATVSQSIEALRRDSRIEEAASGSLIPFYLYSRYGYTVLDGRPDDEQPRALLTNVVDPEYFATMGLRVVAGRPFTMSDGQSAPRVGAVSTQLAKQLWPGRSAIGGCLDLAQLQGPCITVVAVISDARYEGLQDEPSELVYLPAAQAAPLGGRTVFIRARAGGALPLSHVRNILQPLQPTGMFVRVAPLNERLRPQQITWEVSARLFSMFGSIAALLAGIGLFTVVSFLMAQRTRELGIRSALGATYTDITRLVLGTSAQIIVSGLVAGALVASAASSLIRHRVIGVSILDPRWYGLVALLMFAVGLIASLIPAHRAARQDPLRALKVE